MRVVLQLAVGAVLSRGHAAGAQTTCVSGVSMPQGDLPGMPVEARHADACAALCDSDADCALFTFRAPGCAHRGGNATCDLAGGCCWLKREEVSGAAPAVDACACSGYVRAPATNFTPASAAPAGARNVLYLLVDDLRPELEPYGQDTARTPNIARLAATGVVFDRAYCQISVCSPSRMSFLTGRRPDRAGIYNFVNHFRQADCGLETPGVRATGAVIANFTLGGGGGLTCEWDNENPCGGSGQCCTYCAADARCGAWNWQNKTCSLLARADGAVAAPGVISGRRGTFATHASWTSLPEAFRQAGWLTLSAGKVFHTEEGGTGPGDALDGPGMPPNNDPRSWSDGLNMAKVNDVAPMYGCKADGARVADAPLNNACAVEATRDGTLLEAGDDAQLCDRVIADDAVVKLRLATSSRARGGAPWFLAAGFRKPHTPFRVPAPWVRDFPGVDETDVAAHATLDGSVAPIAHHDTGNGADPWHALNASLARAWRLYYRASVAWVDSQLGRVLDALDASGAAGDTLVVLHSDHGWSLGEHGEWEKFSNFEHGTRVPLVMRAPWLRHPPGARTGVLAELIDIFPTMLDALGARLAKPRADELDGVSLLPVLRDPSDDAVARRLKRFALSQYMRCPADTTNPQNFWRDNGCLTTERTELPFMGYTVRTEAWRYTEWFAWNASRLAPAMGGPLLGAELYSHAGDDGTDFDAYENRNEVETADPEVAAGMRALLHEAISSQARVPALREL